MSGFTMDEIKAKVGHLKCLNNLCGQVAEEAVDLLLNGLSHIPNEVKTTSLEESIAVIYFFKEKDKANEGS